MTTRERPVPATASPEPVRSGTDGAASAPIPDGHRVQEGSAAVAVPTPRGSVGSRPPRTTARAAEAERRRRDLRRRLAVDRGADRVHLARTALNTTIRPSVHRVAPLRVCRSTREDAAPQCRARSLSVPSARSRSDSFRRFSLRGLDNVRGEWDLVCLALNVKRLQGLQAT